MNKLKVIDFYADWCGPCKQFAPVFESVSNQMTDIEFEKVNVDQQSDRASEYGIRSIPTIIVERDGQIIHRRLGSMTETALKELIESAK